jgi:hypothetical protein
MKGLSIVKTELLLWVKAAWPVFAWILSGLVVIVLRSRTPAQWVSLGEKKPRAQGAIKMLRGLGLDPAKVIEGVVQMLTGRVRPAIAVQLSPDQRASLERARSALRAVAAVDQSDEDKAALMRINELLAADASQVATASASASPGFVEHSMLRILGGIALLSASATWAHFKSYAVLGAGVLGLAACLSGCAGATPHVEAISPSIVQREGYGTCAETGGKIEVPHAGVVALLTSVCWRPMDAGAPASADAGAPEPGSDAAAPLSDAIKPGVVALVLDGWQRGMCTVPVFAQGAKTLADLDPVRCAVTAPGDRLTVFRRGSRWVTLR